MKAITVIRTFLITTTIAVSSAICQADEKTDQGVKAAESWLALVDAKEYKKSWEEAAPIFKGQISEKDWDNMVSSVRKPLGDVKSRELLGAQFTTTLPGAPEGEYVVIQFKTSFVDKPESVETVVPMKDENDTWRVSGYFIK